MARPQQVSDEEIIEATRACIMKYGPGVSTTVIADQIDVSAQALLKRFKGKQNLVVAALKPLIQGEGSITLPGVEDTRSLAEQLREVAERAVGFFQPTLSALYLAKWSGLPRERLMGATTPPPVSLVRDVADWLESLHQRGIVRCVDFESFALGFLGATHIRGILECATGDAPIEEHYDDYLDLIARIFAAKLAPDDPATHPAEGASAYDNPSD